MAPIVLMTDFGTQDSYVGVMKGVIAEIAPATPVIDLTHEIRPQDLAHAAYTLLVAVPYFPGGTLFCCVIDPGVGSARRAIAADLGEWRFVLPDNGILTHLMDRWPVRRAHSLDHPAYRLPTPSATFHGRDIFAPVAAHLASGVPIEAVGQSLAVETLCRLDLPRPHHEGARIVGHVMHIDRFGNLITTIRAELLEGRKSWQVTLGGSALTLPTVSTTFADVAPGEPVAYIGSDGFLELALRNGSGARSWQAVLGQEVVVEKR